MKKSWTEYLPEAIYKPLRKIKVRYVKTVVHILYPFFARLPIRPNKIVLDNYQGRGYGCNPKYIAQQLIAQGNKYDLVWLVSKEYMDQSEIPSSIRVIRYGSVQCFYEYATAKVWISNYPKMYLVKNGVKKRRGQFFIQTLHGSLGIKKIDGDVTAFTQRERWLKEAIASSTMTDYWISNSTFETGVYQSAFWNIKDEAILLYGHPRNDIFFNEAGMKRARQKVSAAYGIQNQRILLYAPTFRDNQRMDCYHVDFPRLLEHVRQRFGGDWALVVRLHPRMRKNVEKILPPAPGIIDAMFYADMQELLASADCMLTDYSSCAFDFMLTRRPVFLFAPDLERFESERGFYYPLETTPFPLARNNDELMANIDDFNDQTYASKVDVFLQAKGCMEDGHASERVARLVERLMDSAKAGDIHGKKRPHNHSKSLTTKKMLQ